MADDLGDDRRLCRRSSGRVSFAFRNEFSHGSPVIAKMLENYDRVEFDGKALSSYKSYIYGPVCIDRAYRRRGLLRGLYETQKRELAGRFEVGVAFVSPQQSPFAQGSRGWVRNDGGGRF